jgi:hypothetical protein
MEGDLEGKPLKSGKRVFSKYSDKNECTRKIVEFFNNSTVLERRAKY